MTILGLGLALLILGAGSLALVLADGRQQARRLSAVRIIEGILVDYSTDAGERAADRAFALNHREDD